MDLSADLHTLGMQADSKQVPIWHSYTITLYVPRDFRFVGWRLAKNMPFLGLRIDDLETCTSFLQNDTTARGKWLCQTFVIFNLSMKENAR